MNLGKYDKQALVARIMADVPKPDQKQVEADLQEALVKGMSAPVRRLYRAGNHKALRCTRYGYEVGLEWGKEFIIGDADADAIVEPFIKAKREYADLKSKLASAIEPCRTRKQFIDRFPEFSAYAPAEPGKSLTLPAVANVVADLVKHGWAQKVSKAEEAA